MSDVTPALFKFRRVFLSGQNTMGSFQDHISSLKQLFFNEKLENLHIGQEFEHSREIFGYLQSTIAVVSRTDAPSLGDGHYRPWLRLMQYLFGLGAHSKDKSTGLLEVLFDTLDSLLPMEHVRKTETTSRPSAVCSVEGDILNVVFELSTEHSNERKTFSWNLKGLVSSVIGENQEKILPAKIICESLQLQIEILHIIAATLRIVWKIIEWKESADKAPEHWHPQLGYLPRVLQRLYGNSDSDRRQQIWSDRIQRLRKIEIFVNDPLVACLADQVLFSSKFGFAVVLTLHAGSGCHSTHASFFFRLAASTCKFGRQGWAACGA